MPLAPLAIFFVSGFCALVDEVVWARMLTPVLGNTTAAMTAILAAFMAGMALGGWYWGRRIDQRAGRPLLVLAGLEAGIGLYGFIFPLLLGPAGAADVWIYGQAAGAPVVRFLVCLAVLLVPTFLMGGTLAVLGRYYSPDRTDFNRVAALLYGINTAGAVTGTLAAGFIMIEALGRLGTLYTAAGAEPGHCCRGVRPGPGFYPGPACYDEDSRNKRRPCTAGVARAAGPGPVRFLRPGVRSGLGPVAGPAGGQFCLFLQHHAGGGPGRNSSGQSAAQRRGPAHTKTGSGPGRCPGLCLYRGLHLPLFPGCLAVRSGHALLAVPTAGPSLAHVRGRHRPGHDPAPLRRNLPPGRVGRRPQPGLVPGGQYRGRGPGSGCGRVFS